MKGRRIYIHAYSFRELCLSSAEARVEVLECLVAVSIRKMMHNRIVQDGSSLGLLSAQQAHIAAGLVDRMEMCSVSSTLSKIGLAGRKASSALHAAPLLQLGETVEASCFDDNYYTFATDRSAAEAMYRDQEPIATLRQRKLRAPSDPSVSDLTLIKGKALLWRPDLGKPGEASAEFRNKQGARESDLMASAADMAIEKGQRSLETLFDDLTTTCGPNALFTSVAAGMKKTLPLSIDPVRNS